MSSLARLLESRKTYAKQWKIVSWTLGMAFAVFLITDGKATSEHPVLHLLMGAALGLFLGFFVSRNIGANKSK
jgi:hypothetical protein